MEEEKKFPRELIRKKFSPKEIVNIVLKEFDREGRLTQKIKKMIKAEGGE